MQNNPSPTMVSQRYMVLGIIFCVALVAANLLETKVVQIGPFSTTAGLLVFPISYIIGDCIAEVWGYAKARFIIWMGFFMNFFVMIMGNIAVALPAAPYWQGEAHFTFVFGMATRIAAASLAAYLAGSLLNAWVMTRMKRLHHEPRFALRAIASTIAGETIDSFLFFPLAFGGLMPWNELLQIMLLQIAAKTLYEVLALPFTTQLVKYLKKTM